MFIWDNTFLLLIPGLILALWAQARVRSAYGRWSRIHSRRHVTGRDIAERIVRGHALAGVSINSIPGVMTDHYNPVKKSLNLSSGVYGSDSVAAAGIAAHEAGHAVQHLKGYLPLRFRNGIFPVASFGSRLAFPLFLIGIFMGYNKFLMDAGIILFAGFVVFTVMTLPVEFDASRRAVAILGGSGDFSDEEMKGVRDVLSAAALTYVASAAMAILQLLRLLIIRGRRD